MCPHGEDFDNALIFKRLINKPVMDVYAAGISPAQVANKLFIMWRVLERIVNIVGFS